MYVVCIQVVSCAPQTVFSLLHYTLGIGISSNFNIQEIAIPYETQVTIFIIGTSGLIFTTLLTSQQRVLTELPDAVMRGRLCFACG